MKLTLISILFLLSASVPALRGQEEVPTPQPGAPAETRSRFAALDDVRLLANGLLQLGQSLREFVQRTKGQINDIFQKLNIFDRSFYQLSVLASEIKEEGEELKKTAVVLKANNDEIKDLSARISTKVDNILQEKGRLQNQVEGLERKLSSLSQGLVTSEQVAEIDGLRAVIHSQEKSITELLRAVGEQSHQINYQRSKIKTLEEKLTGTGLMQETMEKTPEIFRGGVTSQYWTTNTSSDSQTYFPCDCSEVFNSGERASGVYAIKPNGSEPFMVLCDMDKDYGATVVQRRTDGSVDFDETWENYENGFGDLHGEFWLGLRGIHSLAAQGNTVLQIQLEDWKQGRHVVQYRFHLDGPESNYTVHLRHQSGDLPEPMSNCTGVMFSTKDRDNDKHSDLSCAKTYTGGWWFNACGDTSLNGRYFHARPKGRAERRRGVQWRSVRRASHSFRFTQMSVRRGGSPLRAASASSDGNVFL